MLGADELPVPVGEVGEICVSGPLLSGGYLNLPEVTAETFRDGWLHTGDMARGDDDGYWFIVDRVKDMIVTGGFNVYPRGVGDVVAEHPAVAQVCVIGTPDEKWGEAVTAVIVLRPDWATDTVSTGVVHRLRVHRLRVHRRRTGDHRDPGRGEGAQGLGSGAKQVIVVDSVPVTLGRSPTRRPRARFWEGSARAVG